MTAFMTEQRLAQAVTFFAATSRQVSSILPLRSRVRLRLAHAGEHEAESARFVSIKHVFSLGR